MPLFSIITPLFNKAAYLGETISSVRKQSIVDWEWLIVDNGSTDESAVLVMRSAGMDPRIRLLRCQKRGPGAARNKGIDEATGDWLLFLDADDLLSPSYLEERLSVGRSHPVADVVAGLWREFSDGCRDRSCQLHPPAWGRPLDHLLASALAFAPWPPHVAIIKRERLISPRRWVEELDDAQSEDTAFWFRVLFGANLAWTQGDGAFYRAMTPNSRDAIRDAKFRFKSVCRVINSNIDFLLHQGVKPSSNQRAVLVRVYEREYHRARAAGMDDVATEAINRAEEVLCNGKVLLVPGMAARRLLGVQRFNQMRQHAASVKHHNFFSRM